MDTIRTDVLIIGSGFGAAAPALRLAAAGRALWPAKLDRAALDPYYDRAEAMLRVEQIAPHDVPKSGLVFSLLMKNLGYSCDRARYAVRNCMGSGFCVSGCIYGAKQSLHVNYLPQAVAAGARIECDLEALGVRPLSDVRASPYRYEVRCRRRSGARELVAFQAKIVILGGGTIGSAALLLRSRAEMPRLSSEV